MTRIEEIAAVTQEWMQAKVIGGNARYEQLVREGIPYLLAQHRPVSDDPNPCPRCGRQSGLSAGVSNDAWLQITGHKNGGGHLCLWCMDALAAEKGLSGIHCTLTFAGRAIWSDDDPIEEACQANARAAVFKQELVTAQEALHRYGRHHANCLALTKRVKRHKYCTCGLILARHQADPDNPRYRDCKQCQSEKDRKAP